MTSTVIKGKLVRADMAVWDGIEPRVTRRDSTGGVITSPPVNDYVDVLQAYGNGLDFTRSTISQCVTALGSRSRTLVFSPGTWEIDDNLTIASNFTSRIPAGCLFNVASGKTLTFNGPVIHDSSTWTSGSGTVTESGTRVFTGAESHSGTETHTGTETHSGSVTLSGALSFTGTPSSLTAIALRGHIAGLALSNNATDATNDVDIAAGVATDSSNTALMVLSASITKRLDAAWAVGTNQGGLDTGSIANDVYHLWLIRRSDTGVVDVLFSASATSPTMPTDYDQKRRIGAVIRSSGAIKAFTQIGDRFLLDDLILDLDTTNPGTSAVTAAVTVPDGVKVIWLGHVQIIDATPAAATAALFTSLDQTDAAAAAGGAGQLQIRAFTDADVATNSTSLQIPTDTSAQIRYRLSASNADITIRAHTEGWIDLRGKND